MSSDMCKFYSLPLDALFPPLTVSISVLMTSKFPLPTIPALLLHCTFPHTFPLMHSFYCLPTVMWEYSGEPGARQ